MTVKKKYNIGDTVWIYGVTRSNAKPVQGTVIKKVDLSDAGQMDGPHYVISIPTHIENLLELRTWQNISQDSLGPVGSFRELGDMESTIKFVGSVGFAFDDSPSLDSSLSEYEDEISPEQIHAALEKSQKDVVHAPLNLKPEKPKRRYFKKKVKNG